MHLKVKPCKPKVNVKGKLSQISACVSEGFLHRDVGYRCPILVPQRV